MFFVANLKTATFQKQDVWRLLLLDLTRIKIFFYISFVVKIVINYYL